MLKVGILPGDDIGLEVVPEAVKVMKGAAAKVGLSVDWRPLPIGRKSHEVTGLTVPPGTVDEVDKLDGWLMGQIAWRARRSRSRARARVKKSPPCIKRRPTSWCAACLPRSVTRWRKFFRMSRLKTCWWTASR